MGLDLYDIMGAVGAAGGAVGEQRQEDRKTALLQKMELEREERAEQRRIAGEERAEKRELAEVKATEFMEGEGGVLWRLTKNKNGEVLDKGLASADEIANRNYTREKQKGDIALLGSRVRAADTTADLNEVKLGAAPKSLSLADELTRARTRAADAQATRALRPPAERAPPRGKEDEKRLSEAEAMVSRLGGGEDARRKVAAFLRSKGKHTLANKIERVRDEDDTEDDE